MTIAYNRLCTKTRAGKWLAVLALLLTCHPGAYAQPAPVCGAAQIPKLVKLLKGKKVGAVVNHTSIVDARHLVDTLPHAGVNLQKIFAPEHGFRGKADAGELVADSLDQLTHLPVISLYGKHKKPTPADLKGLDVVIFDIQDVGARFYTYISTLQLVMQACAENDVEIIVLDRPNPIADVIDGPVLDTAFRSFIGMQAIPVSHGLTMAEMARYLKGEQLFPQAKKCRLGYIPVLNYTHHTVYVPPVKPSPNLPDYKSIRLYTSVCLLEGTPLSVGRGTTAPFKVTGAPIIELGTDTFTPRAIEGNKTPLYKDKLCYGLNLENEPGAGFTLKYVIEMYSRYPDKDKFFTPFFNKLAGTKELATQIKAGMTEDEIRKTWQPALQAYKAKRKNYLLYKD